MCIVEETCFQAFLTHKIETDMEAPRETYTDTDTPKETYTQNKRDLHTEQKRPTHTTKGTVLKNA